MRPFLHQLEHLSKYPADEKKNGNTNTQNSMLLGAHLVGSNQPIYTHSKRSYSMYNSEGVGGGVGAGGEGEEEEFISVNNVKSKKA